MQEYISIGCGAWLVFTIQSTFVAPAGFVVVAPSNPLLQSRSHADKLVSTSNITVFAEA